MDLTELHLRKIELAHRAAEKSVELQTHRRLAVLAVTLTFGGSATFGALAGQLPYAFAVPVAVASAMGSLMLLRSLQRTADDLRHSSRGALAAIDTLMTQGGETDVDGRPPADQGGAPSGD